LRQWLRRLPDENHTTHVFVTHDQEEAFEVADNVVVMNRGKVEQVDPKAKTLTVNGENVEGWMSAMTMTYSADKPEVYDTVKPGDQITATVYEGDMSLHKVQVAKKSGK